MNSPFFPDLIIPRGNDDRLHQDAFMQQVKRATNATDVFNLVESRRSVSSVDLISSMKTLVEIQKLGLASSSEIVSHPGFEAICKRLRVKCRNMEYNDIVEIIKILNLLGVQPSSEIYHIFLDLAKQEISSASLMQIVFLDFILQKVVLNHKRRASLLVPSYSFLTASLSFSTFRWMPRRIH